VGATTALTSLTTDTAGTTQVNGGAVTTTGLQDYKDPVTMGGALATAAYTSTGNGAITFEQTLNGAKATTVTTGGVTTFGGAVGGTTALTSLTTDAAGTTQVNGGAVTTTGLQDYKDPVTMGAATTGYTSTGNGAITFEQTLNGASATTVTTGGTTTFGGAVGGGTALTSLTTNGGGTTSLGANVTTSGGQTYSDSVDIAGAAGTTITSGGSQNFNSGLTIHQDTTLQSTGTGNVVVTNSLIGVPSNTQTLTILLNGGTVTLPASTTTLKAVLLSTGGSGSNCIAGQCAGNAALASSVRLPSCAEATAQGKFVPGCRIEERSLVEILGEKIRIDFDPFSQNATDMMFTLRAITVPFGESGSLVSVDSVIPEISHLLGSPVRGVQMNDDLSSTGFRNRSDDTDIIVAAAGH
jgi:hypothetical protein